MHTTNTEKIHKVAIVFISVTGHKIIVSMASFFNYPSHISLALSQNLHCSALYIVK